MVPNQSPVSQATLTIIFWDDDDDDDNNNSKNPQLFSLLNHSLTSLFVIILPAITPSLKIRVVHSRPRTLTYSSAMTDTAAKIVKGSLHSAENDTIMATMAMAKDKLEYKSSIALSMHKNHSQNDIGHLKPNKFLTLLSTIKLANRMSKGMPKNSSERRPFEGKQFRNALYDYIYSTPVTRTAYT